MEVPESGVSSVAPQLALPTVGSETEAIDSRVDSAAQGPIHELEMLFDPATQDVFVIHPGTTIAHPETAKKVEELRAKAFEGSPEMQGFKEKMHASNQDAALNAQVEAKFTQLTDVVNGKVVIKSDAGEYKLDISPAALKQVIRVSMLTDNAAKDRIISVHEPSSRGTHEFYHLRETGKGPESLVHMHKAEEMDYHGHQLGKGGMGVAYKAIDLASRHNHVIVAKELRNPDMTNQQLWDAVNTESASTKKANPHNLSPVLAEGPTRLFNLQRSGMGGVGLLTKFYEKGDLTHCKGSLSLLDKMTGLRDLLEGAKDLTDKNLFDLDIKWPNVFVTKENKLVLADFDQAWDIKTDQQLIDQLKGTATGHPLSSASALPSACKEKFGEVRDLILTKDKAIQDITEQLSNPNCKNKSKLEAEQKKIQGDLSKLTTGYRQMAAFAHTWAVSYVSLALIAGADKLIFADKSDQFIKKLDTQILQKSSQAGATPQDKVEVGVLTQLRILLAGAPPPTSQKELEKPVASTKAGVLYADFPVPVIDKKGGVSLAPENVKIDNVLSTVSGIVTPYAAFSKASRSPPRVTEGVRERSASIAKK
jgi:hypothetical protein